MIDYLGSRLDHLRFRMAINARLIFELSLTSAGFLLAFLSTYDVLNIIGIILSIASATILVMDVAEKWRRSQATKIVENEEYVQQIESCTLPDTYELFYGDLSANRTTGSGLHHTRPYITSPTLNLSIDNLTNKIYLDNTKYQIPEVIGDYKQKIVNLKKPRRNELKIGLRTDISQLLVGNSELISLQRTDYFSGTVTNELAGSQFELATARRSGRPRLLFSVSDMVVRNNALIPLSESVLSNHIGVSTLVLTADNRIAVQDQNDQMISSNETGVGASGSMNWQDIETCTTNIGSAACFRDILLFAMEREAHEELSASFAPGNSWLTGHARYLERGGKPEFFGISRSTTLCRDLKATKEDERYVSGIWGLAFEPTCDGLIGKIDGLLAEGANQRRKYSVSMIVCLRLAAAYLRDKGAPAGLF